MEKYICEIKLTNGSGKFFDILLMPDVWQQKLHIYATASSSHRTRKCHNLHLTNGFLTAMNDAFYCVNVLLMLMLMLARPVCYTFFKVPLCHSRYNLQMDISEKINLSQPVRKGYVSHRQTTKFQLRLYLRLVSPES